LLFGYDWCGQRFSRFPNTNSNTNTNGHSYGYRNGNCHRECNTDGQRKCDADRDATKNSTYSDTASAANTSASPIETCSRFAVRSTDLARLRMGDASRRDASTVNVSRDQGAVT
jgi:hypothetical protein